MLIKNKWLFTAGAALLIASCGGGDKESQEKKMEAEAAKHGFDADVELNDDGDVEKVKIKTLGGAEVGQNLDLPADFPKDVALSSDWSIMAVSPAPQGGYMVQAMASETSDEIVAKAREAMTADGWTEESYDQPTPQMTRLGFVKDNRLTSYNLMLNGDTIMVQLVTIEKP